MTTSFVFCPTGDGASSHGLAIKAEKLSEADASSLDNFLQKLELSGSKELDKLKALKLDDNDVVGAKKLLLDIARAENFSAVFVDLPRMYGDVKVLVQVHLSRFNSVVFVALGSGKDRG